jgi:anti-anti-sigma factor
MSELSFRQHDEGDWHVIHLDGYVDAHTFTNLAEELTRLVEQGKYKIKLDLEKLTYINSTGLGLLLATHRQLRQHGGKLVIEKVSYKISNILNLLGFSRLMDNDDEGLSGVTVRR